ncbi:cell division protein DrpB [Klebsiella sp. CN_Kp091]|uniref:cell division protein DrpB n=1 Tax=Klebsiella TaxID=570 RepID=UPI00280EF9C6|nr:cell division protein DrpB [Klebsiella aerogenes]MDQ8581586.1 cell division protein DrpB [Klebsiella aerogenes]
MDAKAKRSPGGKLALWAFYAFCGYFVWAMVRYWWIVGRIQSVPGVSIDGELGSTAGKWIGALLGFLVLGGVGAILGAIAWYTRPPIQVHEQRD